MKKLKAILFAFIFSITITPALSYAYIYDQVFTGCRIEKIGLNLWKASLSVGVKVNTGSIQHTINNSMRISLMNLNTQTGLPTQGGSQPQTSWSGISYNGDLLIKPYNSFLYVYGTDKSGVIKDGGDISFIFDSSNNIYPGVVIQYYTELEPQGGQIYSYISFTTRGGCYSGNTPPIDVTPPIEEISPPDPEFSFNAPTWELNNTDIYDIPSVNSNSEGYQASLKSNSNNNFCVSYIKAGVKDTLYALKITNATVNESNGNFYTMTGDGGSQIFYNLKLMSITGNSGYNLKYPSLKDTYLDLNQGGVSYGNKNQTCWSPIIKLYKNTNTNAGMHSDTLNFMIIPKA